MKRNLQNKCYQSVIELSDSDDEVYKKSPELVYESDAIEESKKKKKTVSKNKESVKKTVVKKNSQSGNLKSTKRKNLESPGVSNKKKRKLTALLSTNIDAGKVQQTERNDLTRSNTQQDINIDAKLISSPVQCVEWTDVDYINEINNVPRHIAENIIKLFKDDNTIPFIARYRKDITGSMEPDQLRMLKNSFEQVKIIKHRAAMIIKAIDKLGKWSPQIHSAVTSTKSLADLEHIYSLFKPTSKRSLAEKARELGLGSISDAVLHGHVIPPLASLIDEQREGLRNEEQVKNGINHIIADVINKDKEIVDKVMSLRRTSIIEIQTTQCKTTGDLKDNSKNAANEQKYEMYFNFRTNERNIKPHQILAINRAESQKIISVKIIIPDGFEQAFKKYCSWRYMDTMRASRLHLDLFNSSIDYAYKKLIKPLVIRRVKTEMKERAETASIEVFATNVKQLLLVPPVRGKIILGIDPGFYHGCKLAIVSEHGDVLDTAIIYPHRDSKAFHKQSVNVLTELVNKYKCTILALGNATACRETEVFLSKVIQSKSFGSLNVTYTIVDEAGASIYSCSTEAKSEFPNLNPNLISAISIARRLQDPLAELVKIEPKHLGVGMYQHDLPEKQLLSALDEVVTEAVSFVGVDINTASRCLLRRVAGLTNSKAVNIIEWRTKNGTFRNREQLLSVKGIGSKTFEQCAGFLRVLPETAVINENLTKSKKSKKLNNTFNLLDQTWIHPESYAVANKFLNHCQCDLDDLGTSAFIEKVDSYAKAGYGGLAAQFGTNDATMKIVIQGLTMRKNEDVRSRSNYPLFNNNMRNTDDLSTGTILSGVVRNTTHFGVFVDVGVGRDGLIHVKHLKNQALYVGQHVEVKVLSIERSRNRISLEFLKTL